MAKKFSELTKHWPAERMAAIKNDVADLMVATDLAEAGQAPIFADGDLNERVDPHIPLWLDYGPRS